MIAKLKSIFEDRMLIISTQSSTRFIALKPWQQIIFYIFIITVPSYVTYQYNKVVNTAYIQNIINENAETKKENKKLQEKLGILTGQVDQINQYVENVTEMNNKNNNSEKSKNNNDIEKKISYTIDMLNKRAAKLSTAINNISTIQRYVANKENTSAIGGPYSKKISNLKLNIKAPMEINIENINSEIQKLISLEKLIADMPFGAPVKRNKYLITSYFGSRADPFHHQPAMHAGIDIQHPKKNGKIIATASGVVTFAGKGSAYGNYVDIKHNSKQEENTISTRYAHLSKIFVKSGQFVYKGEAIGTEGATGRASGRHVHYEVRINNTPVNPLYLVENKRI